MIMNVYGTGLKVRPRATLQYNKKDRHEASRMPSQLANQDWKYNANESISPVPPIPQLQPSKSMMPI